MQHTSASMQSTSEQSASLQGALPSHEKHLTALTRRSLLKAGEFWVYLHLQVVLLHVLS